MSQVIFALLGLLYVTDCNERGLLSDPALREAKRTVSTYTPTEQDVITAGMMFKESPQMPPAKCKEFETMLLGKLTNS